MRNLTTLVVAGLAIAACLSPLPAAEPQAKPQPQANPWLSAPAEQMAWFQDAKFGFFVCWGPVTLTGQEIGWSRGKGWAEQKQGGGGPTPAAVYDNLYTKWKPDKFDADAWVQLALDGGMKYMIFLVKHHDGYSLYDTKLTDYKSTSPQAAWQHDVMADIAKACQKAGLKLFIYYSQPDWHHPDYRRPTHAKYIQYLHGEVRELLTHYGRIDGLWFDGLGGSAADWDAEALFKLARSLQPHLLINNRCGLAGDFDTPEQHVGRMQFRRPWESCITLGTQWSWKPNDALKPYTDAVQMLVACAVGGGNLALNTNPMPDGQIEPRQADSFRKIGQWLTRYGDSIYGTRGGPLVAPDMGSRQFGMDVNRFAMPAGRWWGGATWKDKRIFLHVLRWPADTLELPAISRKVVSHQVLTGGQAQLTQTDAGLSVSVPAGQRDPVDTIIELTLDGPAADVAVARAASQSLAFGKKATCSNYFQKQAEFSPDKAFDDDLSTRWGCDWGTKSAWLAVDLGREETFDRAYISEPYGRVKKYELQVRPGKDQNEPWTTFHSGTTIGEDHAVTFRPATGRHVRLNLIETTEGPSIWEFQLFTPKK